MNIHQPLSVNVSIWNRLRADLAEAHGLKPEDPDYGTVLTDTLDGCADLGDQIHALLRLASENELFATALDHHIKSLRTRKERLAASASAIRGAVAEAAHEAGLKKLPRPDMTISFGMSKPSLAGEADANTLDDEFVRVKREINRTAIKKAIDEGRHVPGFRLSNGRPTVTVRTA
jgi:hypothetical protein